MKPTILCLFAILAAGTGTAGAPSMTEPLPVTDAEKIADALKAAPSFITDGAGRLSWIIPPARGW